MEKITEMENKENNNINIEIATRLAKIGKEKGENVYMDKTNQDSFLYQGRKIGVKAKVVGVKVGDIPDGSDYIFTVDLGDLAVCHDFYDVINEIKTEKGANLEISSIIYLEDCIKALRGNYESINSMITLIKQSGLKDRKKIEEILKPIIHHLNMNMSEYFIRFYHGMFILDANDDKAKNNIINKDKIFIEDMNKIEKYFKDMLPNIQSEIENAVIEQKREEEESRRQQNQKAEDLQNQL